MQTALTRQQTVAVLMASEPEIRALGVARLALFGSVLRNPPLQPTSGRGSTSDAARG